jgi:hypothetical protein
VEPDAFARLLSDFQRALWAIGYQVRFTDYYGVPGTAWLYRRTTPPPVFVEIDPGTRIHDQALLTIQGILETVLKSAPPPYEQLHNEFLSTSQPSPCRYLSSYLLPEVSYADQVRLAQGLLAALTAKQQEPFDHQSLLRDLSTSSVPDSKLEGAVILLTAAHIQIALSPADSFYPQLAGALHFFVSQYLHQCESQRDKAREPTQDLGVVTAAWSATTDASLDNPMVAYPIRGRLSELLAAWERLDGDIWCARNDFPSDPPAQLKTYRDRFNAQFDNMRAHEILSHRIAVSNHRRRKLAAKRVIRYLTTRTAIERYMRDGVPTATNHESRYAGFIFSVEERLERARFLLELLKHEEYQVGLFEGPWPEGRTLWTIYGLGHDRRALCTIPVGATYLDGGWVLTIQDPQEVDRLVTIFERYWNDIPLECKDKAAIEELLLGLIQEIS